LAVTRQICRPLDPATIAPTLSSILPTIDAVRHHLRGSDHGCRADHRCAHDTDASSPRRS